MTSEAFRRLALSLPETIEGQHMNHPDFRVRGKIFASLGYPKDGWATVMLNPEQQENFFRAEPNAFIPIKGAWGRGACKVLLKPAKMSLVRSALRQAWSNKAPQALAASPGGK